MPLVAAPSDEKDASLNEGLVGSSEHSYSTKMEKSAKLQVLYEDNHLIGVAKPQGLLTQADSSGEPCLLEQVRTYLKQTYQKPGDAFVGLLHRLDKPVSGVVIFAKTSKGASRLSEQIRNHTVRKIYHALVEGRLEQEQGTLVHYLGDGSGGVEVKDSPAPGLKRAELTYRALQRASRFTMVEVELKTGRKHQIRTQFAALGHPIAGDRKYGASLDFGPGIGLASVSFEFAHPVRSAERICVALPVGPLEGWREWL